jgi:hypothetical protein
VLSIWSKAFNAGCASRRWKDSDLCRAVSEMESGLIDANLGSGLFKKRIGRSGAGKREGYRVIVARHPAGRWFFVDGYAKNRLDNVEPKALRALREEGAWLTGLSQKELAAVVGHGHLKEVMCDEEKEVRHR